MQPKLLDRKVKVKVVANNGHSQGTYKYCEAEMTVREAIKGGYLLDNEVAIQIFEQLENQ